MRKPILVLIAVVLFLLLALDRVGLLIAEQQIAKRVRTAQNLQSSPDVSIKGLPFLTQVISGHYAQMDVTVRNVTRNGLTVDRLQVSAHGVIVPLGQVISGKVKEVSVDRAEATVSIGFANLNKYIAKHVPAGVLTVSGAGDKLKLTGTLPFPPWIALSVETRIDVSSNSLTLRPASVDTALSMIPGGQALRALVEQFFTVKLPISQLPFGISLKQATVVNNAIVIAASATGLTFRNPSG
jgi:hypothetical protein